MDLRERDPADNGVVIRISGAAPTRGAAILLTRWPPHSLMKKQTSSAPTTKSVEDEIQEMVDRETNAWNSKDADALVSIFHPDMVWPWPKDENAHAPVDWVCPMGRHDRDRWKTSWQKLFDLHTLVHNRRTIVKITVTEEHDGAFAIVDVDTLWRHRQTGQDFHWKGRACKIYTKIDTEWKLISHVGLLKYHKQQDSHPAANSGNNPSSQLGRTPSD